MKTKYLTISQSELKKNIKYYPDTGIFIRIKSNIHNAVVGKPAGYSDPQGYVRITIHCIKYKAHRLALIYMYGESYIENKDIDHINHMPGDNRLSNLRVVSPLENSRNSSLYKCNTSGVHGVTFLKDAKKWRARIIIKGKEIFLGRFTLLEDAIKAKRHAERIYGFHKNHGL